jgi:hypothetical protein
MGFEDGSLQVGRRVPRGQTTTPLGRTGLTVFSRFLEYQSRSIGITSGLRIRTSHLNSLYLSCLDQHPDFACESQYTQYHMALFSRALAAMPDQYTFEPRPASEAKQADIEISEDAAISRLRPIQVVSIIVRSTGVVRIQSRVAPRPAKLGQYSDLAGRGPTSKKS